MEKILENERKIVEKAQKDPEAFGVLYDFYYSKIARFIWFRTGNTEIAQDLTSETFFQALKNLWRYRFMRRPFSSWLYKIATTQVALYYRQKKKYCSITLEGCPEILMVSHNTAHKHPSLDLDKEKDIQWLYIHLARLRDIWQNVVVLRYFEEKSIEDISIILHLKPNTVKSHLRRALLSLRDMYIQQSSHFIYDATKVTGGRYAGIFERSKEERSRP